MESIINSYDLIGLSQNDIQASAPDGAIVFVTSTLNCNLVMCQARESIIHSISAGERRLKVQDMPQVIKVVKIRRYTMRGKEKKCHSSFSSILTLSQEMCLSKKPKPKQTKSPNQKTVCRGGKKSVLNSIAKDIFLLQLLKGLCYQLHFFLGKQSELKPKTKLQQPKYNPPKKTPKQHPNHQNQQPSQKPTNQTKRN